MGTIFFVVTGANYRLLVFDEKVKRFEDGLQFTVIVDQFNFNRLARFLNIL